MIFTSLLPVFVLIVLGWSLRRFEVIPRSNWSGIEKLGFWVLFPALLFNALARAELKNLSLDVVFLSYGTALTMQLVIMFLVYKKRRSWFTMDGPAYSTVFQTSTRWNAFIALAVMDKLGGDAGLAVVALIMALTIPTLNFINIIVVAYTASQSPISWLSAMGKTARNPMIWGALLGIFANVIGIPIYGPVEVSLDLIGRAGLGVGLLAVGAGLKIRSVFSFRKEVWIGTFSKMVFFPLMMWGLALLFDAAYLETVALVLCASIPAAMNGYMVASNMGGDAPLYATITAAQTLLAIVTIPAFLWLVT
ncbi:MAG: AEC family transporter [Pseudomonadota bacterium]